MVDVLLILLVGVLGILWLAERQYANKMKRYARYACDEWKLAVDRHRTDRETFVSVKAMQDEWAEVIGD